MHENISEKDNGFSPPPPRGGGGGEKTIVLFGDFTMLPNNVWEFNAEFPL